MNELKKIWSKHARNSLIHPFPDLKKIKESKDFIVKFLFNFSKKFSASKRKKIKVLDAGCGIGGYIAIAKILGFRAEGIDIADEAVKIAKSKGLNVKQGDIRKLPYKNKTFDIVISGGVVEHFPETYQAIKEIARVLKKGGFFIGNVPYKYSVFSLSRKIQQLLKIWKLGYEKAFTIKEFRKILEDNNFKIFSNMLAF